LFNFFESYLNKSDKTDAEEEPDLALNDHFSQFMANRGPKTPMANRSVRRISCFADIENQKGVLRQSSPNRKCDQSMDESMSEVTLPWNLNDMNEKEVMDLMNTLEEEVAHKEANCPQLMATSLRENFDKQMLLFNDAIEELEKTFNGSLQEIGVKSAEERSDHSTHSVHDCDLHNDYDNQKLFNFFESYLNKSDKTDAEEEPDLALNDHFSQFMANRGPKTPMANRSVRRISCFADIENQKGVLRQSSPNRKCDQSMDESMSEVTLPWNLNDMNEKEVIDLINTLEEELDHKAADCPQLMATSLRENFDKQLLLFNDAIEELEKTFNNSLQEIGVKSTEERYYSQSALCVKFSYPHRALPTLPAMAYSSYYGGNRRDNNTESGMYARDGSPPRQQSYGGRRSPQMGRIPKINPTSSLDDLRSEFNRITDDTPLKVEDMTWEKMGTKVQDILEKRTNDPNNEGEQVFPAPMRKRNRDKRDMPLIINGNIVPRKDALLIDLVLNNKSTLDAQLTLTKHPVVGLEYMIEYIDPEGMSPRIYYCRLCKQFNTCASVMEHVTGYNHRVRFIANKYPNQAKTYLLPDGRRANRNVALMRMAQGRAQELELVYGRGDFEIRHEKVTIPD
ncbi:unnamed protein product, partial [Medioppia subpectinata]